MTRSPSDLNTPANAAVKTGSRSWIRNRSSPRRSGEAWDEQLAAGVIATCPVVELEFLYSARSLADRLEKQRLFHRLFTRVPMPDDAYERASEIQQRLTETGHHRSAGPVDLLISVAAERHRLTVLTDDRDFLTVAAVTGQPVRLVTGTS